MEAQPGKNTNISFSSPIQPCPVLTRVLGLLKKPSLNRYRAQSDGQTFSHTIFLELLKPTYKQDVIQDFPQHCSGVKIFSNFAKKKLMLIFFLGFQLFPLNYKGSSCAYQSFMLLSLVSQPVLKSSHPNTAVLSNWLLVTYKPHYCVGEVFMVLMVTNCESFYGVHPVGKLVFLTNLLYLQKSSISS